MKLKGPQCTHKTESEAAKGNGRCSRCAMPTMPINHIRFWSSFWHSATITKMKLTGGKRNREIVQAIADVIVPNTFPGKSSGQYV